MLAGLRLSFLAIAAAGLCIPQSSIACLPLPPPPPPPRTESESEADFVARSRVWYIDWAERERKEREPEAIRYEDGLWAKAERVVLARIEKVGSTRVRNSEGQFYKSPLVTLRPMKWFKGDGGSGRLKVHYLSDDSCDFGGAGNAPNGEKGDVFLLFFRKGAITPERLLDSFDRYRAVTQRTRAALKQGATEASSRPPAG